MKLYDGRNQILNITVFARKHTAENEARVVDFCRFHIENAELRRRMRNQLALRENELIWI